MSNGIFNPVLASSGGTGGGGSKNYLAAITTSNGNNTGNGDFETGLTTGFTLGTIGTLTNGLPTGTPTFGSGASGNLSLAIVSSGQLAGTKSLSYVSSAATTAGNMVASDAFNIDNEDQAKVLTWKFYYKAFSGSANCNFSGTSSNSFGVAFWDSTTSSWLSNTGSFNLVQVTGIGYATGTFQTNVTTTSIRMCIYNVSATTGAVTMYFDDLQCGPQTAPYGPVMGDPVSYLPTYAGLGTVTTTNFETSRDGKFILGYFQITTTTPTGVTASFSIPSGITIDTSNIGALGTVGQWGASATPFSGNLFVQTGTANNLVYFSSGAASATAALVGTSWASGTVLTGNFKIPINGYSSNAVSSADTDTRVISLEVRKSANQSVTANVTNITLTNTLIDRAGSWNGSDTYTVPVAGDYMISGSNFSDASTGSYGFQPYINGSAVLFLVGYSVAGSPAGGSGLLANLKAGDLITIRATATATVGGNGVLSIYRLSGPAVVQGTESINGRYFAATATLTASDSLVTYTTKSKDSHNAYASGTLTIPISGMYQFNAGLASTDISGVHNIFLSFYQNGVIVTQDEATGIGAATPGTCSVADSFPCLAGDLITVRASDTGTTPTVVTTNTRNYFSWNRTGN